MTSSDEKVQENADDNDTVILRNNNRHSKRWKLFLAKNFRNSNWRRSFRLRRRKSCTSIHQLDAGKVNSELILAKNKRPKTVELLTSALLYSPLIKMQPPAPLVVRDPPSSDDGGDFDDIKHLNDPAHLHGSSSNFGGAGTAARSAPSTPQGILGSSATATNLLLSTSASAASSGGAGVATNPLTDSSGLLQLSTSPAGATLGSAGGASNAASNNSSNSSIHRSPSHSVFNKNDKSQLKSHLSSSTPAMTAQAQITEPPSPKTTKENKVHRISKGRQKKFFRQFPNAGEDEKVLNHYSCALIGDILLQGHLYITNQYFAFYSNVFGYVTKLLIPITTVEDITKEKTAKIIPNAVGILTSEDKHVFGSLMSRDNTIQFMKNVWEKVKSESPVAIEPEIVEPDPDVESTETGEGEGESGRESPAPEIGVTKLIRIASAKTKDKPPEDTNLPPGELAHDPRLHSRTGFIASIKDTISEFRRLPRHSLILVATTLLLTLLFLSAGVLLYRISRIQNRFAMSMMHDNLAHMARGGANGGSGNGEDVYSDLLQWQTHLHSKSAGAVHSFLDSNLDQIAKVRQSLEALSTLLIQNNNAAPGGGSSFHMDSASGSAPTTSQQPTAAKDTEGS